MWKPKNTLALGKIWERLSMGVMGWGCVVFRKLVWRFMWRWVCVEDCLCHCLSCGLEMEDDFVGLEVMMMMIVMVCLVWRSLTWFFLGPNLWLIRVCVCWERTDYKLTWVVVLWGGIWCTTDQGSWAMHVVDCPVQWYYKNLFWREQNGLLLCYYTIHCHCCVAHCFTITIFNLHTINAFDHSNNIHTTLFQT